MRGPTNEPDNDFDEPQEWDEEQEPPECPEPEPEEWRTV